MFKNMGCKWMYNVIDMTELENKVIKSLVMVL